jgi:hypothetical protein
MRPSVLQFAKFKNCLHYLQGTLHRGFSPNEVGQILGKGFDIVVVDWLVCFSMYTPDYNGDYIYTTIFFGYPYFIIFRSISSEPD